MATPQNALMTGVQLRGKFPPILRLSLIGRILLPVRVINSLFACGGNLHLSD
jgi:hypothetical protein